MSFISKLVPRPVKKAIKKLAGKNKEIKIERIANDIAARIVAEKLSADESKFSGKVIMVTGAGGFIGQAIAKRFLNAGAKVLAMGRNVEKLKEIYDEKENVFPLALDITKSESVSSAVRFIESEFGSIDVLVNCAGGSARDNWSELHTQKDEIISEIINTNLTGTILCTKYVSSLMIKNQSGSIINVSSTVGVGGKAGFSEYAASKGGVMSFTKSLALEMGKYGVTVNCVTPGIVNRGVFTEDKINEVCLKNCMGSIGIANDVAYVVEFFASDEAKFITGQNLIVDGGRSLGLKGDS